MAETTPAEPAATSAEPPAEPAAAIAEPPAEPAAASAEPPAATEAEASTAEVVPEELNLEVTVTMGQQQEDGTVLLNVSLQPSWKGARQPSDIVCVIDISGSMGMEATIVGAGGQSESHGLSLLDVAKHGVRTIAHALNENDRLAVVTFNHASAVAFPLTYMDEAGKAVAEGKLDELASGGGTNIWLGLKDALECLSGNVAPGHFGHIMLLTDGESQQREAIIPNLLGFKGSEHEGLPGSINTFGFGYNLDSRLMVDLAEAGQGSYSFIPDAGFVGTAFVNMMSQLLTTAAQEVSLVIEKPDPDDGITLHDPPAMAGLPCADVSHSYTVSLGSIQFGQSRDTVVRVKATAQGSDFAISGNYRLNNGLKKDIPHVMVKVASGNPDAHKIVMEQWCRCRFVEALRETLETLKDDNQGAKLPSCLENLKRVGEEIRTSPAGDCENVKALLEDICGQSTEALCRWDWYSKWGVHYIPSVMFAHQLQICNNFKDPGVQVYGGKLFKRLQEEADEIFCNIPAPKPTARRYSYGGASGGGGQAAQVSMAAYHNSSAVCVDGSCLVKLEDGSERPLETLSKGARIQSADGKTTELVCLVRTACEAGRSLLVEIAGGLRLTPYHPILLDGEWRFPCDVAEVKELPCEAVYSFVVAGTQAVTVAGVPCVALGHGMEEGAAAHPYFSSRRVVEDLAGLKGFEEGLVDLSAASVLRDPNTGLIVGLAARQETEAA